MLRAKLYFMITLTLLTFSFSFAFASDIGEKREELSSLNEQINDTKLQLREIQDRQRATSAEIENLNLYQAETESALLQIEDQLKKIEQSLDLINEQLHQKIREFETVERILFETRDELADARGELKATITKMLNAEELMSKRIRVMYMNRDSSYLKLLLQAENINHFLVRMEMITSIIAHDLDFLENLALTKEEIDKNRVELEGKESQIQRLIESMEEQRKAIELIKSEQTGILTKLQMQKTEKEDLLTQLENREDRRIIRLSDLEREQAEHEKQLEELQRTSARLEAVIQELIRQREEANRRSEFVGGLMQWPVPGFYRVSSPFGYRIHPVFNTRSFHAGIDIGSNFNPQGGRESIYGRNFVAALDGTVIFVGPFGGYGNTVIIDHGGEITTLYAHGSVILVNEGQRVVAGTPVMTVGSTGVSTGPHAHFEVRVNGRPVDPIPYLQAR